MNLSEYIIQIVEEAGQITLPTLGRFELMFKSSSYNPDTKETSPPSYYLIFSQQHNLNDTHLFEKIALWESKNVEEIRTGYYTVINSWKSVIKNEGTLTLDKLGTFTSEKEKINFQISKNCPFSLKDFGLPVL